MQVQFIFSAWGLEALSNPLLEQEVDISRPELISKLKEHGFQGIEIGAWEDLSKLLALKDNAEKQDFKIIIQCHSRGTSLGEHICFYQKQLEIASLMNPVFVNSHTGKDFFDFEQNVQIIQLAKGFSEEKNISIYHESHRGRFPFCLKKGLEYLKKIPDLHYTADFSHWCNVSESLLEDQLESLELIIPSARYIHARVGYEQGPQVSHPAATEYEYSLNKHLMWWEKIIRSNKEWGVENFYICPEFGPWPYNRYLPFSNQEYANIWDINLWMKKKIKKELLNDFA